MILEYAKGFTTFQWMPSEHDEFTRIIIDFYKLHFFCHIILTLYINVGSLTYNLILQSYWYDQVQHDWSPVCFHLCHAGWLYSSIRGITEWT